MGEPCWIDETKALGQALERLGEGPLALDLEADSLHHFHEKVCLIQLSDGTTDLLIDPLAGVDLSLLAPVLADRERRKVLHGADYDIRMLRAGLGLELRGLFDTMVAARLAGEHGLGLAALLSRHLGVELDKRFQRADWSVRPLPAPLREYAALDTRHLRELARGLERRLTELGRLTWAEEEFRRLEDLVLAPPDPEPWRRTKGAAGLGARELALLRELSGLRDAQARARDRPRFRILRDEVLVEAARVLLRPGAEPEQIPGLPSSWSGGASWQRLCEAAGRVSRMEPRELPGPIGSRRPPRDPERERRIREFALRRDRVARDLGLEPSIVASRSQLEDVLDSIAAGGGLAGARKLRDWQRELLDPVLADLS